MWISMCVISKSFGTKKSFISLCIPSSDDGRIECVARSIWRENLPT